MLQHLLPAAQLRIGNAFAPVAALFGLFQNLRYGHPDRGHEGALRVGQLVPLGAFVVPFGAGQHQVDLARARVVVSIRSAGQRPAKAGRITGPVFELQQCANALITAVANNPDADRINSDGSQTGFQHGEIDTLPIRIRIVGIAPFKGNTIDLKPLALLAGRNMPKFRARKFNEIGHCQPARAIHPARVFLVIATVGDLLALRGWVHPPVQRHPIDEKVPVAAIRTTGAAAVVVLEIYDHFDRIDVFGEIHLRNAPRQVRCLDPTEPRRVDAAFGGLDLAAPSNLAPVAIGR